MTGGFSDMESNEEMPPLFRRGMRRDINSNWKKILGIVQK
jgi:hypothetical protein